ncbi:hypothetical protein ILYODFUR_012873 [Ilyodon furcidens]|uniref:Uncharacterized protein n=1 Tax=Ilyodon furcidens TaxID=33524 RepID=A0ABV0VDG9_9TELE
MNDSSDGLIYNYVEELQTPDPNNNLVTRNNQQSLPDEVHNAEMPGFATAHCAQYHQLQAPQHIQQLQDSQRQSTSSGMSGYSSEQYNSPPGLPQRVGPMTSEGTTSTRMIQCLWCLIMVAIIARLALVGGTNSDNCI